MSYFYRAMKKLYAKIPSFLKNKYSVCIIAFVLWLAFFDKNDFITQYQYRKQLNVLKADKKYYTTEIEKSKKDLSDLISSQASLEKFAREKYLMKKDDEDIFVFVSEKKEEGKQN
jgi:cell division protein FtsB